MITPINGRSLHMIRGGAANAPRAQPDPARHTSGAAEPSTLARNVETLVLDAYKAGLHHGEAQHFREGWRWGVLCGLLPGAFSGVALLLLLQWIGAA